MFESSPKSRKSWNERQRRVGLKMYSRCLKQQMKMIWRLPWWFLRGGIHIDKDEALCPSGIGSPLGTEQVVSSIPGSVGYTPCSLRI